MSWHISAVGKPAAVLASLKEQSGRVRCAEPEETIKAKAVDILETALAAFPANVAVDVQAGGSQTTLDHTEGNATNSLNVVITPLWGFIE